MDSLGWYYYKVGNLKDALKQIQAAVKLVKDDPTIIKHLGIVYRDLKNYSKAKEAFKEALRLTKIPEDMQSIRQELEQVSSTRLPASE